MALAILLATSLLLAYANGSNDNFKSVATLYGTGTLSYRRALWVATAAQLAGSAASLLLAGALLRAFGGKGLVSDEVVADPRFLIAVGAGSALTVLAATRIGMPISTTHAMIGGLVGAALALQPAALAWERLGQSYLLPLLVSPALAVGCAATIYPLASLARRRLGIDEVTCFCAGRTAEPVAVTDQGAVIVARSGVELSAAQVSQCRKRYDGSSFVGLRAQGLLDALHVTSGVALGFARGLNDTPKVLALLVAATWSGLDPRVSLVVIAAAMAAGGILHSRRIAETLGHRITEMNHGQGFVGNFVASGLVIGASLAGMPVSTTHVSTGAIFGIGLWTGRAKWRVVAQILTAWVVTLPAAGVLGCTVAWLWPTV